MKTIAVITFALMSLPLQAHVHPMPLGKVKKGFINPHCTGTIAIIGQSNALALSLHGNIQRYIDREFPTCEVGFVTVARNGIPIDALIRGPMWEKFKSDMVGKPRLIGAIYWQGEHEINQPARLAVWKDKFPKVIQQYKHYAQGEKAMPWVVMALNSYRDRITAPNGKFFQWSDMRCTQLAITENNVHVIDSDNYITQFNFVQKKPLVHMAASGYEYVASDAISALRIFQRTGSGVVTGIPNELIGKNVKL